MDEFDDDFWVRPGPRRGGQERAAGPGFLGQVRRAMSIADEAGSPARRGPVRRGARGAGRGGKAASDARRVIVKARIVRHRGARFRAAPLGRHIAYLEREGVTRDGTPAAMFDAQGERADVAAFAERCAGDRHHFRFIVSPEDASAMADLRGFARDLMGRAARDLGAELDWVAVDHWNTDNPHLHILVRGRAEGRDLVIAGDYIARGLRDQAQALATLELGPRTAREIAAGLEAEVQADRWTSLDRDLARAASPERLVDLRPPTPDPGATRRALGRLGHLQRLGLAEPHGAGRWRLADDLEARLRHLAIRGDIIKTLHRALAAEGGAIEPGRFSLEAPADAAVVGRLVARGLHDELTGEAYAIIDGLDGRQHHLRFADLEQTGDARPGAIVERPPIAAGARPALFVRSDLPIEAQVAAPGATWLDRQLVRQGLSGERGGFAAAAADAAQARLRVLAERGLAAPHGAGHRLAPRLLDRLQAEELAQTRRELCRQTGLVAQADAGLGETVAGTYRRRLDLASGRFAMIEDGLGFRLVPWRPSLEPHLGRAVVARMLERGMEVAPGRRGLGL